MRKRKVVKIDSTEFTLKELTVAEILELMDTSGFFGGGAVKGEGVEGQTGEEAKANKKKGRERNDLDLLLADIQKVMVKCCDFSYDDLKPLAPSEIRQLYEGFTEVNADFLETLKGLGIANAISAVKQAILSNFSKLLVTSLKLGM